MPNISDHPVAFRFGAFEVDIRGEEIRRHGLKVRLRGKPFEILTLLLERAGEVVTREELQTRLWPADTFVDFDHGLNAAVNKLRDALGDSAENPRFIETIPRRGYRFIGARERIGSPAPARLPEVAAAAAPAPPPLGVDRPVLDATGDRALAPSSTRWIRWGTVGALICAVIAGILVGRRGENTRARPPAGKVILAVLPFENLSGESDQEYFSDGVTEEMIAQLGALNPQRLGVIARTTVMQYKGAKKSVDQIGRELGVDYVLEGSVRRAGGRVRITAQLVQVSDQTHLWADSYEPELADVLALQRDVAGRVASSLAMEILPSQRPTRTVTPAAYELYLRGRSLRQQATAESAWKAIEYFERATAADPSYAPAYAGIADTYLLLGAPGWDVRPQAELLPRSKVAAARAMELDPALPEAYSVMAMVKLFFDWNALGAETELKRAISLNPSSAQAHQYYSTVLLILGRLDESVAEATRALQLDPLSATAGTTLGLRLYYAGRYDRAIEEFRRTLEINPSFAVAHWGLGQGYRVKGDTKRSLQELQQAADLSGGSLNMRAWLAYGLALAGETAKATAILRRLEELTPTTYVSPFYPALIHAGLGDTRRSLENLERAYNDRSGWMIFLPVEPEFESLHRLPGYQRLLARVHTRS